MAKDSGKTESHAAAAAIAAAAQAAARAGIPDAPKPFPVPDAETIKAATEVLVNAAVAVTRQSGVEVVPWAVSVAPTYAVAQMLKADGDPRGDALVRSANAMAIGMAGNLGLRLLQSGELALLSAIQGGLAMIGGPAAGALAQAVTATAGAVIDTVRGPGSPASGT